MLTALVRWHRRGEPKANDDLVGPLDDDRRERVRRLVALLRIADGLDRSRHQVVDHVAARVGPSLVLSGSTPAATPSSSSGAPAASASCSRRSSTASSRSPRIPAA